MTQNQHSPIQIQTKPLAILRLLLFTIFTLTQSESFAQNGDDLSLLIFEPVLIERINVEDEIQVNELTILPSGSEPKSTSEFIINRLLQANSQAAAIEESTIAAYEENIKKLELAGGVYEPELSEALLSVSNIYQSQDDHIQALEYLDQALHVNRVNLGLFNLEQEQIIEGKIKSHIALGELNEADAQHQYLFYLKRKAYGDASVELLPALRRFAEWNIYAFDSRLATNPTLDFSAEAQTLPSNLSSLSVVDEGFRNSKLINAEFMYRTIINILLNNFGDTDIRLLDIERKLALTNYFFATNLDINSNAISNGNFSPQAFNSTQEYYNMSRISSNSFGFRYGREALERRINLLLSLDSLPATEITKARIELADWLLIFNKRTAAFEAYKNAYDDLAEQGADEQTLASFFSPVLPETIPAFINYRFTRSSLNIPENVALNYQGWFDVSIHLNRFGQPQNIEILDRSPDASDAIESRLSSFLGKSTSYRPRFSNGEILERETFEARYYYSY